MTELFPIGIDEQIACVEREIALRRRVYPRRVADRKMTQALAEKQAPLWQPVYHSWRCQLCGKWMKD
jgi:hypothetical protein